MIAALTVVGLPRSAVAAKQMGDCHVRKAAEWMAKDKPNTANGARPRGLAVPEDFVRMQTKKGCSTWQR